MALHNDDDIQDRNAPLDPMAHLRPRRGDKLPIDPALVGTTQALFYEHRFASSCPATAPYTLSSDDVVGTDGTEYKSMYLIFMECNTEYEAAIKLLGSWKHWEKLCKAKWFKDYVESWREEMALRAAALGYEKLIYLTQANNVTAAKALVTEAKVTSPKNTAGRPVKALKRTNTPDDALDALLQHAAKDK